MARTIVIKLPITVAHSAGKEFEIHAPKKMQNEDIDDNDKNQKARLLFSALNQSLGRAK